jgi:hypothetical protein
MFKWMRDVFKFSDYFSQSIQLNFYNKEKFSTELGGLITLSIFSLIVTLIINTGKELILRKSPKTNHNTLYNRSAPMISMNSDSTSFFSFKFIDKEGKPFYDERYFKYEITLEKEHRHTITDKMVSISEKLKLTDCSKMKDEFDNSFYNLTEEYEEHELYDSKCIENKNISIGGPDTNDYIYYIKFQIVKCTNSSVYNLCWGQNEIEEKIVSSLVYVYFIDRFIDLEDIFSPFKVYIHYYYNHLEPSLTKSTEMYFKKVIISSDKGVIFQEINNFSNILYNEIKEEFQIHDVKSTKTIYSLSLYSSKNVVYITRTYMKFGDLTAMIGGILQILIVLGNILTNHFSKYKMYQKIMNVLYDFNVSESGFDNFVVKKLSYNVFSRHINNNKEIVKQLKIDNNDIKDEYTEKGKKEISINNNQYNSSCKKSLILDSDKILKSLQVTEENLINSGRITEKNDFKKRNSMSRINENTSRFIKEKIFYIEILRKIKNYQKTMSGKLKLTYYNIFGMLFCKVCSRKMRKKYDLLKVTENELSKFLDYIEIAKLLQEFTLLKLVLFSKDQHCLFSFISKPEILYNDKTLKNSYLHGNFFDRENIPLDKLYQIYTQLQEKGKEMSFIDKNLLDLLDEDVKKTFDIAIKKTLENVQFNK